MLVLTSVEVRGIAAMPFTEEVQHHAESQAEVHGQARVPVSALSAQGREDAGSDRQGVRHARELGRDLETRVPGARPLPCSSGARRPATASGALLSSRSYWARGKSTSRLGDLATSCASWLSG